MITETKTRRRGSWHHLVVPLTINRSIAIVHLSKGYRALIDADDWRIVGGFMWTASEHRHTVYGYRKIWPHGIHLHLHAAILGRGCDHRNRNGLDNQRSNLRACSHEQNCWNQGKRRARRSASKFIGVCRGSSRGLPWVTSLRVDGKRIRRGFKTEIEAAIAHDELALKYRGEFAALNFNREVA